MESKKEKYKNFEKLTEYLNTKGHPRAILHTVILVCKPPTNSVHDRKQESEICIS